MSGNKNKPCTGVQQKAPEITGQTNRFFFNRVRDARSQHDYAVVRCRRSIVPVRTPWAAAATMTSPEGSMTHAWTGGDKKGQREWARPPSATPSRRGRRRGGRTYVVRTQRRVNKRHAEITRPNVR